MPFKVDYVRRPAFSPSMPPPKPTEFKTSDQTLLTVTNFIQLVSPQPVDRFSQTKLCWEALDEGYPHICGKYKSDNK